MTAPGESEKAPKEDTEDTVCTQRELEFTLAWIQKLQKMLRSSEVGGAPEQ